MKISTKNFCVECEEEFPDDEMIETDDGYYLCRKCAADVVSTCEKCGRKYYSDYGGYYKYGAWYCCFDCVEDV